MAHETPGGKQRDASRRGDPAGKVARIAELVAGETAALLESPLAPGLYLVATPIGNLADISLRALSVLARVHALYCEDAHHSAKLLSRYGISRTLEAYHEHNAERVRPQILDQLAAGHSVALITDAGTPLVSDPGFKLVRLAVERDHSVVSIPGASAALAALTASGLPTDCFFFEGFLPAKAGARRARLKQLQAIPATLVLFESPSRLADMLSDLAKVLGDRRGAIARELTKLHEEMRRDTLANLAEWAATANVRGELTIVVGPPALIDVADTEIERRLEAALATMSVRDAVKVVAEVLGVAKARVYDLALALRTRRASE